MTGYFGGTFDPFHCGHIHLATEFLKQFPVEKLFLVPTAQNPLKTNEPTASAEYRLKMLKVGLAEWGEKRAEVCELEIWQKERCYTVDTVKALHEKGFTDIILLMGNEVFSKLPEWKTPNTLLSLVQVAVANREQAVNFTKLKDEVINKVSRTSSVRGIHPFTITPLDVSATELRMKIARAWRQTLEPSMPQGIQHGVWQVIKENHLYAVT